MTSHRFIALIACVMVSMGIEEELGFCRQALAAKAMEVVRLTTSRDIPFAQQLVISLAEILHLALNFLAVKLAGACIRIQRAFEPLNNVSHLEEQEELLIRIELLGKIRPEFFVGCDIRAQHSACCLYILAEKPVSHFRVNQQVD